MRSWLFLSFVLLACHREEPARKLALVEAPREQLGREDFVGSARCADCHRAQGEAFASSHHAKALLPARAKPQFDATELKTKLGGTTKFELRDGAPFVTSGARYPISYVSGVWPLEQYVVATERGKLQALGVVWDSRTRAEGGDHWFHVYGKDGIRPDDPLYFTKPAQNWNHMCAECHSTWLARNYDAKADSFDTTWAELSVGCEACHGPGAAHARAAPGKIVPLPARLKPSAAWLPSGGGSPIPHPQDGVEVEVCAPCHSRRRPLKEAFVASDPFLDTFAPELLLPGPYHADGQVEGEVYEWGSFVQSRMYQAGVRCSDCHDPHSGQLQAQGNALCVRCHEPARFDTAAHANHPQGKAQCVDCHMPPSTFMQIDLRRDHSIRIPRPDLSLAYGTPNACNGCHSDKSVEWAKQRVASSKPHFVQALAKDRKGTLDAPQALRAMSADLTVPAIARATALERLSHYPTPKSAEALRAALSSREPLIVYGAVLGTAQLPVQQRAQLLLPVLTHSIRAVRIEAAKLLAGVPLPPAAQPALARAFDEVMHSFAISASRAETHVEQSAFELARGQLPQAEASLQTALRLEPCLAEAHLNLADLARQRGDEAGAEQALRAALGCHPENAAAHHALGLWQVRAHRPQEAIESLKTAVALAPNDARFRYVLAVALHGSGERREAIATLEQTLQTRPNDAATLQALASYLRDDGQTQRADEARRELDSVLRD